jgi:hypothetical protein
MKSISTWEYAEDLSYGSENKAFEENDWIQRVLHRPVEPARLTGMWDLLESHIPIIPFYKRGRQEKCFPGDGKARWKWSCRPAPVM